MYDEIPLDEIKVNRLCPRCFRDDEKLEDVEPRLVSSHGVVHHSGDYGMTECGRDATGRHWWWAL